MTNKTKTMQEKTKDVSAPSVPKIGIKTSSTWEFVFRYLDVLRNIGAKCDEGFYQRYEQLMDYVCSKIVLPDCEVLEEYHVYVVTMNGNETASKFNEEEYQKCDNKYIKWHD